MSERIPPARKSTPDEIRARFDADVERFANLESGQAATIDAPLVLELIAAAAAAATPEARCLLDVGCGAGNYTLKLLEKLPGLEVTLVDLSRPMLDRARERIAASGAGPIHEQQGDIRELHFAPGSFDVILAAAVLHHLRDDEEWRQVFAAFHRWLRPGGALWVSDLVDHASPAVRELMWRRYGDYLATQRDEAYRDAVLAYIDREDTPRPLEWQLDLLREVGFHGVEILHKNSVFAAYGAQKA